VDIDGAAGESELVAADRDDEIESVDLSFEEPRAEEEGE